MTTRQYISSPGVYVCETGTRSEVLAPGVYVNETVRAATIRIYAAFATPQDDGVVQTCMIGY